MTDPSILRPFSLEEVMQRIVATSGVTSTDEIQLFQQWWDTQHDAGGSFGLGQSCDTDLDFLGAPGLNDYPWECPRGEGYQAGVNPFVGARNDHLYMPIGLFNRFDLAPGNGGHCGEYRIVFAFRPGHPDAQGLNYLIFEAVLRNPDPGAGLNGCLPVAEFWADLSTRAPDEVSELLYDFYFNGLPGFDPVVHAENYGVVLGGDGYGCSTGQIRTNQFVGGDWNLREYRVAKDCRCIDDCLLSIVPATTKASPWPDLFSTASVHPLAPMLQSELVNQVGTLLPGGVDQFSWTVDDQLNAGESVVQQGSPLLDPFAAYQSGIGSNPSFFNDIDNEINALYPGMGFHPDHVVARAQALTCAGCHEISNGADLGNGVTWPNSLGFVHVSENLDSNGHHEISDALRNFFLPFREELMMAYIESGGEMPGSDSECELPLPPELTLNCDELGSGGDDGGDDGGGDNGGGGDGAGDDGAEPGGGDNDGGDDGVGDDGAEPGGGDREVRDPRQLPVRYLSPAGLSKLQREFPPSLSGARTH